MSREFNRMHNEYLDPQGYYDMEENAACAQIVTACAKAIFDRYDAETMYQVQRRVYKYTDCGPAISFELHESACEYADDSTEAHIGNYEPARKSPFIYCGDNRADTITQPWLAIRAIGVSSIVEGSDAEVPLEWIDFARYCDTDKYEGDLDELAAIAVKDFEDLVARVNDEACALWHEANDSNDSNMLEMG